MIASIPKNLEQRHKEAGWQDFKSDKYQTRMADLPYSFFKQPIAKGPITTNMSNNEAWPLENNNV